MEEREGTDPAVEGPAGQDTTEVPRPAFGMEPPEGAPPGSRLTPMPHVEPTSSALVAPGSTSGNVEAPVVPPENIGGRGTF